MADNEVTIINHLIEVEHAAETIFRNAQEEADKKISDARISADKKFKEQYEQIVKENEQMLEEKKKIVSEKYETEIRDYKNRIINYKKDIAKFETLLDDSKIEIYNVKFRIIKL